jgi:hypothetical protein
MKIRWLGRIPLNLCHESQRVGQAMDIPDTLDYLFLLEQEGGLRGFLYLENVISITPKNDDFISEDYHESHGYNIDWKLLESVTEICAKHPNKQPVTRGYNINTEFGFGKYRTKEIGLIYSIDVQYIVWCINNVETFFIWDLEELMEFGVLPIKISSAWMQRTGGFSSPEYYIINSFQSIQEIYSVVGCADLQYQLPLDVVELNALKRAQNSQY